MAPPVVGEPAVPLPPPPAGAETVDQGTFALAFNGQPAGRETFAIRKSDVLTVEHDSQISVEGNEVASRGTLTLELDWKPRTAAFKGKVGAVEVDAALDAGPPLAVTTDSAGKKETLTATRDVDYFFADNVIVHLTPICVLPGEATTRYAFPGMELKIAAPAAVPESAPVAGVLRRTIDLGGALAADVYCQGDKIIAVDSALRGFTATRAGSEELASQVRRKERQKPALADGLVELDRKVEVAAGKDIEAATLACSLVVPASHADVKARQTQGAQAALPAVILIGGSGKQDRDGDSYGPGGVKLSVFKVIASELGKAGIASLRCDDRGTGGSTGDYTKGNLPAFTADAAAMVAALRVEPAVDPKRVGAVGHSAGASRALLVASTDRKIRSLVLMGGPGRPLDVVVLEQIQRALERSGMAKEQVETELTRARAALAAIRKGEPLPADVPESHRATWEQSRTTLHTFLDLDPAATARKVKRAAVLIAQGDKDQQVTVADAEALRAALAKAGNKKVEYKVYPDHNHLFAVSTTGNPSEYADANTEVDPAFAADVAAFLKKRL